MKRIFLLILLFLFAFTFMFTSASAEILTIWDDANNLDGKRPAEVIYRINGDIADPDNPPSDWQSITADPIPGYTVTGPIYQDDHIVFIHHHKPASKAFSVTNNLKYATLTIAMNVTDSGPDEEFRVRLQFGLPGEFKCAIGDTESMVGDGSVLILQAGQTAVITLPIGTRWSTELEEKTRYNTTVAIGSEEPNVGHTASGVLEGVDSVVAYNNTTFTTPFTVTKRWSGEVGGPITLHLFANGEPVEADFSRMSNRYTAVNLPVYDYNGNAIVYTATEEYMDGYLTSYVNYGTYAEETRFLYDGGTVINREVVEFRVYKEWVGIEGEPPEIILRLYDKDGELPPKPIMRDNWYIWKLPIAYSDHISEFYVLEEPMQGFVTEYLHNGEQADCARNGDTIRNTMVPPTGERQSYWYWLTVLAVAVFGLMVCRRMGKR